MSQTLTIVNVKNGALYGGKRDIVYPVRNNAPLEFLTGFTIGLFLKRFFV